MIFDLPPLYKMWTPPKPAIIRAADARRPNEATFPFPTFCPASVSSGNDANTKLLIHCDGSNGSTSFTDSSASARTVTATSATVSTTSPKFGTGSVSVSGAGSLSVAASADWAFGSSDFSVDFWIKTSMTGRADICGQDTVSSDSTFWGLLLNVSGSGQIELYEQNSSRISATSTGFNNGNWRHLALSRTSNVMRLFLDGTVIGSPYTTSFSYGNSGAGLRFCLLSAIANFGLNGNMDEIRVSNTSRWSSNFSPPTSAYS